MIHLRLTWLTAFRDQVGISLDWLPLVETCLPNVSSFSRRLSRPLQALGLVVNPLNPSGTQARAATSRLGMDFKSFEVREAKDFEKVFAAMAKARVDSILVSTDTLFQSHASKIASLATTHRLASVGSTQFAEAGGLIGYGVNDAELFRRGAYFVHRILTGSKPGDLPIEQPTRFEMVVNAKTATALGIAISKSILIRADREIA